MADLQPMKRSAEQRRESRLRLNAAHSGVILLRDGHTKVDFSVVAVRDCSPSGASVLMRQAFTPGRVFSLLASSDGVLFEHFGTIAWCRAASQAEISEGGMPQGIPLFMVGLHMRGPVSLAATLMSRPSPDER